MRGACHGGQAGPLLEVIDIAKSFSTDSGVSSVLNKISFELEPGSVTSLLGSSGSGKSTLMSLLAGLLRPDSGSILFRGTNIAELDDTACARLRSRHFGVVPQRGGLLPYLTAEENVAFAMNLAGLEARKREITAHLGELGVAHRSGHFPREMSGGEAVRVAVAMALATKPELILADEATGELDPATARETMDVIVKRSIDHGVTLLYVTHDVQLADKAQRRLTLTDKELAAS